MHNTGEPASFFGVVLKGAVEILDEDGESVGVQRELGSVIGEMALFYGGVRTADAVGAQDGYLAVFSYAELEALKTGPHSELAHKLNTMLADVVLAHERGKDNNSGGLEDVSALERQAARAVSSDSLCS